MVGCNEEQRKELPMPKYDDMKIITVEVITKDGVKCYSAFSDLILQDEADDYLGFVYIKFYIMKDEDGVFLSSYMKPEWMVFKEKSYSIGSKVEMRFNTKKDEPKVQEENDKAYCLARGIFQINQFLHEQDMKEKNRK